MNKHTPAAASTQAPAHLSAALAEMCYLFVRPLLVQLDRLLDRRLVQTLLSLVQVILMHRHRNHGLLLSELGAYLLTPEPVGSVEDAWRIVFAYARRWQVEMALRFNKSELAFESPRLWKWEDRCKFLLIAALAYAFL